MYALSVHSHLSRFVSVDAEFDFLCEDRVPFHPIVHFVHVDWYFIEFVVIFEMFQYGYSNFQFVVWGG